MSNPGDILSGITLIAEQLRFLRPAWFFGFIPLALFVLLMRRRRVTGRNWKAVCDPQLLPHLLAPGSGRTQGLPLLLTALAVSLVLLALAGPVWKKLPQPVFRETSALVIALDLSQSMNATDLKPSRLERAKLKLLDLLAARRAGQTALLVYAAGAFTVTPLTDDANTISNLLPALSTELMPAQGSNADSALEQGADLLRQAGLARGDILLVTDGLNAAGLAAIEKIHAAGHRVSVLGVGTAEGSPIPLSGGFLTDTGGAIVIPRLQSQELQRAALHGGGLYTGLKLDDSDINRLAKLFDSGRDSSRNEATELNADTWREEGPWLLLPLLLLVMLWPRRGWLALLAVFVLPAPQPAYALDFGVDPDQLWRSPDQQGMQAFEAGDAETAAKYFEDPRWKAAALYRAGDYAKASELLQQAAGSQDSYNRGNALAKMGKYPEAVKAYENALELDAGNEDARYNLELVKQQMAQQNRQNSPSDQNEQDPQQDQESESRDSESQDRQQQSGELSDQQDQQYNQDQQNTDQQNANQPQDQQAQDQRDAEQKPQAGDKADEPGDEQQQADRDEFGEDSSDDVQQQFADQMDQEQQQQQAESDSENAQQQDREEERRHEGLPSAQPMAEARDSDHAEITEDDYATEQLLRRIPDDPGGLMRRKFIYQYQQMPNQRNNEQPW